MKINMIVLGHNEGQMLFDCALSAANAWFNNCNNALGILELNIIFVVDVPDAITLEVASMAAMEFQAIYSIPAKVLPTSFGDPGMARNYAINCLGDDDLAWLIDGDDLIGKRYFKEFLPNEELLSGKLVLHPEYIITFGMSSYIYKQPSRKALEKAGRESLFFTNAYDLNMISLASILREHPFPLARQRDGFGYEDWHFMLSSALSGITHDTIPLSIKYARIKPVSRNLIDRMQLSMLPPLDRYLGNPLIKIAGTCLSRDLDSFAVAQRDEMQSLRIYSDGG